MQYFLSIEDCQFFRWQLGILLQSMSDFGLEDSLVIACAKLDDSLRPLDIPGTFYHDNFGRRFGYLPLNKPFGLAKAIESGFLKVPFAVIDPDMIMTKPLHFGGQNVAQYCSYLEYENLASVGYDISSYRDRWCPGGCVYCFDHCDLFKVSKIAEISLGLKNRYESGLRDRVDYWQREMVSFAMVLSDSGFSTRSDIVSTLDDGNDCNFIHYCNGLLPFFNKRVHNNLRGFSLGPDLPFDAIASMPEKNRNIRRLKRASADFAKNPTILG
jgi:hypothetical protein